MDLPHDILQLIVVAADRQTQLRLRGVSKFFEYIMPAMSALYQVQESSYVRISVNQHIIVRIGNAQPMAECLGQLLDRKSTWGLTDAKYAGVTVTKTMPATISNGLRRMPDGTLVLVDGGKSVMVPEVVLVWLCEQAFSAAEICGSMQATMTF